MIYIEKTLVNGSGNVAGNVWLLACLRLNINIFPTSGHRVSASASCTLMIYCFLCSSQRI
jgi:hypothetical protein